MRTPECHPKCRHVTKNVNDKYCAVHACWVCGSRVKFYDTFYVPKLMTHKQLGFCSKKCFDSFCDEHQHWTVVTDNEGR